MWVHRYYMPKFLEVVGIFEGPGRRNVDPPGGKVGASSVQLIMMTIRYARHMAKHADNMLYKENQICPERALEARISGAVYSLYATIARNQNRTTAV